MNTRRTKGEKIFAIFNFLITLCAALTCLLPFINVIAISLSSNAMVSSGAVTFWPKGFSLNGYQYLLTKSQFWQAFWVSIKRVGLGVVLDMFTTIITAYPLAKYPEQFRARKIYIWYFFFTMLFNGGLVPTYLLISQLNLMDTMWALVLPSTAPVWNIILLLNFFRTIPSELEDAAYIDGAGHWRTLFQIYVPCALPSLATLTLFCAVGHWNGWFEGLIYMDNPANYPLQSYLKTVFMDVVAMGVSSDNYHLIQELSDDSIKCAQIVVATIPILLVYPFLQKYFVKGITLGSVKG